MNLISILYCIHYETTHDIHTLCLSNIGVDELNIPGRERPVNTIHRILIDIIQLILTVIRADIQMNINDDTFDIIL